METKRALVTGGAGFIGSHLTERLIADGWGVTVLDDLSSGHEENLESAKGSRLRFIQGSVTDPERVDQALAGATHVFHLAARPSVARSVEAPLETNEVNVTGTLLLLERCRKLPALERFVMTSSSAVYGDTPALPKTEAMAGHPLSPYALQKWTGEGYVRLYHRLYGLPGLSVRPFNVFGPRQRSDNPYAAVIPLFISAARAGAPLVIHGDGGQTRDFTCVANMVDGLLLAGIARERRALGQAFNIANSERTSILDLARLLLSITGSSSPIEHRPSRVGDVRDSLASIEMAKRLLGYSPKLRFLEGLTLTCDLFRT